jgi:hypothetical protein
MILAGCVDLLTDYLHRSVAQHCVKRDDITTSGVFFTRTTIVTLMGGQHCQERFLMDDLVHHWFLA